MLSSGYDTIHENEQTQDFAILTRRVGPTTFYHG